MRPWHNALESPSLSLDGEWDFSLAGQVGRIRTPGVWEAQGYDREVDGPAIYRRRIIVPAEWAGASIQLQCDALSYHVEVMVNSIPVGEHRGLWTAFAIDVTHAVQFGQENMIELTVYKPGERFPLRQTLAGFLPDVCIPFGGLWQSARLIAFRNPAFSDVWLLPDAEMGRVRIHTAVNRLSEGAEIDIRLVDPDGSITARWHSSASANPLMAELSVPTCQRWSPASPRCYTAELRLESGGDVLAEVRQTFGFRTLSSQGEQLLFNGEPVCLRGVLNWGWYPEILCPAPDAETIRSEFRRIRQMGYNLVKLCLVVPSSLYFDIADEEGMFLWLELPMWLPDVTPELRAQAPLEYEAILAQVHHHPSIVLYSLGCELDHAVDAVLLDQLNGILRSRICGALACDNSGSGEAYGGLAFDYADFNDYHFYCDLHYFTPLVDHFNRDWRAPRPWIFGEFCDADDYRDLNEIAAAHDGVLPWTFTTKNPIHAIEKLAYHEQAPRMAALPDIGFSDQDLQRISRQSSFAVRKLILEKVRGRAGMGGYVVTGLRDTPLATSAMFDDLSRAKVDVQAFRAFNADTVLILEQGRARQWQHGGDRPAPMDRFNLTAGSSANYRIVLAHAGPPLSGGELRWRLQDTSGIVQDGGELRIQGPLPGGSPRQIAALSFIAPSTGGQYTLAVEFGEARNEWPLWVYPPVAAWPQSLAWYDPSGALENLRELKQVADEISSPAALSASLQPILVTSASTDGVMDFVRRGGRALILQTGPGVLPALPRPFWRESVKLLMEHPVWESFPHRGYTDMQFYHMATDYVLDTARFTSTIADLKMLKPIFRRLDARLFQLTDYLVELHLGEGVAMASSLRFGGGAGDQVPGLAHNVVGRHLLFQMLHYLASQPSR